MARSKKKKVKGQIQGRTLRGKKNLVVLKAGQFAYGNDIYDIDDFPPNANVNLDSTDVLPVAVYIGKNKRKKQQKEAEKHPIAWLYSNIGDCPDVQRLLEVQKSR